MNRFPLFAFGAKRNTDESDEEGKDVSTKVSQSNFWQSLLFQGQEDEEEFTDEEGGNGRELVRSQQMNQERQVLLLMLLAQVCALHDPTPRTFAVHVRELYDREILDLSSIRFVYDLGLMGNVVVSPTNNNTLLIKDDETKSVQDHPLKLSRYQRDFKQIRLLATGGFGQVFHVKNNLDEREYAVKRILNIGEDDLQIVLREVQCLAACTDHPNVVRYYTSWLEPSWMTNNTSSNGVPMIENGGDLSSWGTNSCSSIEASPRKNDALVVRKPSVDDSFFRSSARSNYSFFSDGDEDVEDWSVSRDDSSIFDRPKREESIHRHQICLFIQMQLCHPTTLADWLQRRTEVCLTEALDVFANIVHGLAHVHAQNIVHRDLKPSNVFWNGTTFQVGDFGLSKQRSAATIRNSHSLMPLQGDFTAGVGTANYAAPEQITSCNYGSEADVFSLGLILVELCCNFTTDHERLMSFQSLRQKRRVPEELQQNQTKIASVILRCTEKNPKDRPTAVELKNTSLYEEDEVKRLRRQIYEMRRELDRCKASILSKDRLIEALQEKVTELEHQGRPMPLLIQTHGAGEPASSSDSSDGGI